MQIASRSKNFKCLTISGPLQQKLEEPVTWIFLTFLKYVYTLTSKKKNCNLNPDRLVERGFKLAGQDILCIVWTHLLWCIIWNLSCKVSKYTWIWSQIFWDIKKFGGIFTDMLFSLRILAIFDFFFIFDYVLTLSALLIPTLSETQQIHQGYTWQI